MKFLMQRSVLVLLCVLVLVVVVSFTMVLLKTYRENRHFRSREYALQSQFVEHQAEVRQREKYLNLILHDPGFLEGVVREKLGYVRPDEFIFRFEERDTP